MKIGLPERPLDQTGLTVTAGAATTAVVKIDTASFTPLPEVAWRILEATADIHSSAAGLEEIILRDQALTTRTLRMANSAYFGLRKEAVSSITDDNGYFEVHITISDVPLFQTITFHFTKEGYRKNYRTIDALTSLTSYNLGYITMKKKPFSPDLFEIQPNPIIKNLQHYLISIKNFKNSLC